MNYISVKLNRYELAFLVALIEKSLYISSLGMNNVSGSSKLMAEKLAETLRKSGLKVIGCEAIDCDSEDVIVDYFEKPTEKIKMKWNWKLFIILSLIINLICSFFSFGVLCRSLYNYDLIKQIGSDQISTQQELEHHLNIKK